MTIAAWLAITPLIGVARDAEIPKKTDSEAQSELYFGAYLPSDRETARTLDAAERLLAGDTAGGQPRYSEAIAILDSVLAAGADAFDSADQSVKSRAAAVLSDLPPAASRAYELLHRPSVDRGVEEALSGLDGAKLAAIVARYPAAGPGAAAWRAFAAVEAERGAYRRAAVLQRAVAEASGEDFDDRFATLHRARAGDADALRALDAAFGSAEIGREVAEITRRSVARRGPSNWFNSGGDAGRTAAAPGATPESWLRWRAGIESDASDASLVRRLEERLPLGSPRVVAAEAIAVAGLIVTTDRRGGVVGVDAATGKRVWQSPFTAAERDRAANEGQGDALTHPSTDRYWHDRVGGAVSADCERVYAVTGGNAAASERGRSSRVESRQSNRLCAYELATQGKLLWSRGGSNDAGDLSGARFLGPPVADEGWLFGLAVVRDAVTLFVLDAESGETLWSQPLAVLERGVDDNEPLRLVGVSPTLVDGLVVCPTGVGIVAAVDPYRRRVVWVHRLPPDAARLRETRRRDWRGVSLGRGTAWKQRPGWRATRAIPSGDAVVVASVESQRLHCLDLASGDARWSVDEKDGVLLAGVARAGSDSLTLVLRHDGVVARDVRSGDVMWRLATPSGDRPAGDALFVDEGLLVSLTSGRLARIDLSSADPAVEILDLCGDPLDHRTAGGNLLYHDGAVFVRNANELARYDQPSRDRNRGVVEDAEQARRWVASRTREGRINDESIRPQALAPGARRRLAVIRVLGAGRSGTRATLKQAIESLVDSEPERLVIDVDGVRSIRADRWALGQWLQASDAVSEGEIDAALAEWLPSTERDARATRSEGFADGWGDAWSRRQVMASLETGEPRGAFVARSRFPNPIANRKDRWISLRRKNPSAETPRRWRLHGERGEARLVVGVNPWGEPNAAYALPGTIGTRGEPGAGRSINWLWGRYLVIGFDAGVGVYDTLARHEVDTLLWETSTVVDPPLERMALDDDALSSSGGSTAGVEAERIVWVSRHGVVTHRGGRLRCRDLKTGQECWRRRATSIARVLGDDERLLVQANREHAGEVLRLVDGARIGRWRPPRGDWAATHETRVVTKRNADGVVTLAAYDYADREAWQADAAPRAFWQKPLSPQALTCSVSDSAVAALHADGALSCFDLRTTKETSARLGVVSAPSLLQAHYAGERLLVLISRAPAAGGQPLGRRALFGGHVVDGNAYCLDRVTGESLWQSPVRLGGEEYLPTVAPECPLLFFGSTRVAARSGEDVSQVGLTAIDAATGRVVFRREDLAAVDGRRDEFVVQIETAPSPSFLVRLGENRLRLDLVDIPAPPAPPYQADVEQRAETLGDGVLDLGRLIESIVRPGDETAE